MNKKEMLYEESFLGKYATEEKQDMEMLARRKAMRGLDVKSRNIIQDSVGILREKTGLGLDASLSLLFEIGMILIN